MTAQLKLCPFCGMPGMTKINPMSGYDYLTGCANLDCRGYVEEAPPYSSKTLSEKAWNTRKDKL